jgi:hypothetical protein
MVHQPTLGVAAVLGSFGLIPGIKVMGIASPRTCQRFLLDQQVEFLQVAYRLLEVFESHIKLLVVPSIRLVVVNLTVRIRTDVEFVLVRSSLLK